MFVDLLVVGGGAAGFFSAITCAGLSDKSVLVLEKTSQVLQKVCLLYTSDAADE